MKLSVLTEALSAENIEEIHIKDMSQNMCQKIEDSAKGFGADMLITHHPMIFSPIKKIHNLDFVGGRILKLIQNDISYYAMHTNYDVLGMAKLAEDILGIEKTYVLDVTMEKDGAEEGIGRIGMLEREMTLEECCLYVKHKLKLGSVKVILIAYV